MRWIVYHCRLLLVPIIISLAGCSGIATPPERTTGEISSFQLIQTYAKSLPDSTLAALDDEPTPIAIRPIQVRSLSGASKAMYWKAKSDSSLSEEYTRCREAAQDDYRRIHYCIRDELLRIVRSLQTRASSTRRVVALLDRIATTATSFPGSAAFLSVDAAMVANTKVESEKIDQKLFAVETAVATLKFSAIEEFDEDLKIFYDYLRDLNSLQARIDSATLESTKQTKALLTNLCLIKVSRGPFSTARSIDRSSGLDFFVRGSKHYGQARLEISPADLSSEAAIAGYPIVISEAIALQGREGRSVSIALEWSSDVSGPGTGPATVTSIWPAQDSRQLARRYGRSLTSGIRLDRRSTLNIHYRAASRRELDDAVEGTISLIAHFEYVIVPPDAQEKCHK